MALPPDHGVRSTRVLDNWTVVHPRVTPVLEPHLADGGMAGSWPNRGMGLKGERPGRVSGAPRVTQMGNLNFRVALRWARV